MEKINCKEVSCNRIDCAVCAKISFDREWNKATLWQRLEHDNHKDKVLTEFKKTERLGLKGEKLKNVLIKTKVDSFACQLCYFENIVLVGKWMDEIEGDLNKTKEQYGGSKI